jgi:hypothetical protein
LRVHTQTKSVKLAGIDHNPRFFRPVKDQPFRILQLVIINFTLSRIIYPIITQENQTLLQPETENAATSQQKLLFPVADNIISAISETKISEVIIPHKVGRTVLLEGGRSSRTRNMI